MGNTPKTSTVECRRGEITAHACWARGCRQYACVNAHLEYMKRYRANRNKMVDAAPVSAHIRRLRRAGMTYQAIANAAGVGYCTISDLGTNNSRTRKARATGKVQATTARVILAVRPTVTAYRRSTIGAARRLQALATNGWAAGALADRVGMDAKTLELIRRGDRPIAGRDTLDTIAHLYDELWDKQCLSKRADYVRNLAQRRGWVPPLAWNDEELDDPRARPQHATGVRLRIVDNVAVEFRTPKTPAERRAAVAEMWRRDYSILRTAEALHLSTRSVSRIRQAILREQQQEAA